MTFDNVQSEDIEISLLLEAIYLKYGYDFRKYRRASVKRQILRQVAEAELKNITELTHCILYDDVFFQDMVLGLTINVTEMFRDPSFFHSIREEVFPVLKTKSHIKIWHAGCSTGEEVYSMVIMLKEHGLLDKSLIYATDINETALTHAREGVVALKYMKTYTENYRKAGGMDSFSEYYSAAHDSAIIEKSLFKKVLFTDHNLVTDGVFGEMDLVICRNVLIYFSQELQNKVIKLFLGSLAPDGFLCLGSKESLEFSNFKSSFVSINKKKRIYGLRDGVYSKLHGETGTSILGDVITDEAS